MSVTSEARVLPSAPALRAGQGICVRARGLLLRGLFCGAGFKCRYSFWGLTATLLPVLGVRVGAWRQRVQRPCSGCCLCRHLAVSFCLATHVQACARLQGQQKGSMWSRVPQARCSALLQRVLACVSVRTGLRICCPKVDQFAAVLCARGSSQHRPVVCLADVLIIPGDIGIK